MALRRSPKPGALTAQRLERAAELVDDQGRQGLALDVLGDDRAAACRLRDFLQQRAGGPACAEIFLSWIRMYGFSSTASWRVAVGDEVGGDDSRGRTACLRRRRGSVSRLLDSSTVMTPSLPTFSMASAIRLPISWSLLAEMVATWAISSLLLDVAWTLLLDLLDDGLDGLVDAALEAIGLAPAATFFEPSL